MPANATRTCVRAAPAVLLLALLAAPSCGDDDGGGGDNNEQTGDSCSTPAECYPGIEQQLIEGEVVCIDRVPGGYCSHRCTTDADCCAVQGECETDHPQVCAPFESTGEMYCFLSCEDAIVGTLDANVYCGDFAHSSFQCRSSGGGSANRKVCVPG